MKIYIYIFACLICVRSSPITSKYIQTDDEEAVANEDNVLIANEDDFKTLTGETLDDKNLKVVDDFKAKLTELEGDVLTIQPDSMKVKVVDISEYMSNLATKMPPTQDSSHTFTNKNAPKVICNVNKKKCDSIYGTKDLFGIKGCATGYDRSDSGECVSIEQ